MSETTPPAFHPNDALLDTLRKPVPLCDYEYRPVTHGFPYERLQLPDIVLSLLVRTAEFRNHAISYRGFKVGAGAMATDGSRIGRVLGYNVKLDETDDVNIHAEDLVTAKAEDFGFDRIAVLAVIGPTQEDHASGKHTATLHPCGRCRGRLEDSPLVNDDMLIATATPDFTTIELSNLGGIQKLHDEGDESDVHTFRFDKTPEVFSPLPQPDERGYIVPSEHEVDDTDWQLSVGRFLVERYVCKLPR